MVFIMTKYLPIIVLATGQVRKEAGSGKESQGVGVKSIVSGVGPSSHGKTVCNGTKVQNLKEEKVLWSW